MRKSVVLWATIFLAAAGPTAAQEMVGDKALGRELAESVCVECHAVAPRERGESLVGAPAFQDVADEPSATEMSLRVFLRTPHMTMPNFALTDDEIDNLVAYIRSLD